MKELDVQELAKQDIVLLYEASEYRQNIQDCLNCLGEVLDELVIGDESVSHQDTLKWMSKNIAETRTFLMTLMSTLKVPMPAKMRQEKM